MEVLLLKDNEFLGTTGQVINVKNGYARNYLIPNGIATSATSSSIKKHEEVKRQQGRKVLKEQDEAKKVAEKLNSVRLEIKVKTGEDNKVFGSVTGQMIADELKEKGFDIDRRKILTDESIKSLGEHKIDIKLHSNVTASIILNVTSETDTTEKAEEQLSDNKELSAEQDSGKDKPAE
jgi:large subunit ribosomal protein L9